MTRRTDPRLAIGLAIALVTVLFGVFPAAQAGEFQAPCESITTDGGEISICPDPSNPIPPPQYDFTFCEPSCETEAINAFVPVVVDLNIPLPDAYIVRCTVEVEGVTLQGVPEVSPVDGSCPYGTWESTDFGFTQDVKVQDGKAEGVDPDTVAYLDAGSCNVFAYAEAAGSSATVDETIPCARVRPNV